MKRLVVSSEQCTGCESCSLTCSFGHEGAFSLLFSRVQIERDEALARFKPRVCIQCAQRTCLASCPVGALSVNGETGAIRVDEQQCIGCKACETACPHGGIHFAEERMAPIVCDLCGGDPACVSTCRLPMAIQYVEVADSCASRERVDPHGDSLYTSCINRE